MLCFASEYPGRAARRLSRTSKTNCRINVMVLCGQDQNVNKHLLLTFWSWPQRNITLTLQFVFHVHESLLAARPGYSDAKQSKKLLPPKSIFQTPFFTVGQGTPKQSNSGQPSDHTRRELQSAMREENMKRAVTRQQTDTAANSSSGSKEPPT